MASLWGGPIRRKTGPSTFEFDGRLATANVGGPFDPRYSCRDG